MPELTSTPLDPDSPRGRELARELTILLDEIGEEIEERERREAAAAQESERPRRAA